MRVRQLLEAVDFSPLAGVWQSKNLSKVLGELTHMGDEGNLLVKLVEDAKAKAETSPEIIFNFIEPLIDADNIESEEAYRHNTYNQTLAPLIDEIVTVVLKMDPPPVKLLASKVDMSKLKQLLSPKLKMALDLANQKVSRTKAEVKIDKNTDQFVFIARPKFVEEPDGKFRKTLEIEKLVKVDRFDINAHQTISTMKIRARVQDGGGDVYTIRLPKGVVGKHGEIEDWLIDTIDKHKTKVTH
jgi:hypothetical protein